jgi:sialate O-acetylesterase
LTLFFRFAISLVVCLAASGQGVRITSGLTDHQVIQRGAGGKGILRVSGTAPDGTVEMRFTPEGGLPGSWTKVAEARAGQWPGELRDVPAGGPYKIELRAAGATSTVEDVLVGDLWILAGQSNMEGVGDLVGVQKPDPRFIPSTCSTLGALPASRCTICLAPWTGYTGARTRKANLNG